MEGAARALWHLHIPFIVVDERVLVKTRPLNVAGRLATPEGFRIFDAISKIRSSTLFP